MALNHPAGKAKRETETVSRFRRGVAAIACAITLAASHGMASAAGSPEETCTGVANFAAQKDLPNVIAAIRAASNDLIELGDNSLDVLKPIFDGGDVQVNAFLIEKNYNDALLKRWHLLYYGWQSLYLRCTYLKIDGDWMMVNFKFETEEEDIDLP